MTVTPKGIVTPEDNGPWNLVTDLTIMGNTTDTAITNVEKGANLFKGTSAQRTAWTTAPEGVVWVDTDGDRVAWQRQSGSWVTFKAYQDTGTVDLSSYLIPAWRGTLLGRRVAGTVWLRFSALSSASLPNQSTTDISTALPVEWRPDSGPSPRGLLYMAGGWAGSCYLTAAGVVGVVQATGAARTGVSGSLSYIAG